MEIDIREFKEVIDKIFSHIMEVRGIESINLGENFYWSLSEDQSYDMSKSPEDLGVGSLDDDWEFISKVLNRDAQPVAYQLVEAAQLLKRIGEVLGKKLASEGG